MGGHGLNVDGQILNAVLPDHLCFADLFEPNRGCFQNSAGVNYNRVPYTPLIDKADLAFANRHRNSRLLYSLFLRHP